MHCLFATGSIDIKVILIRVSTSIASAPQLINVGKTPIHRLVPLLLNRDDCSGDFLADTVNLSGYCLLVLMFWLCLQSREPRKLDVIYQLLSIFNHLSVQNSFDFAQKVAHDALDPRLLDEHFGPCELVQIILIHSWSCLFAECSCKLLHNKWNSNSVDLLSEPGSFLCVQFVYRIDSQIQKFHLIFSIENIFKIVIRQASYSLIMICCLHWLRTSVDVVIRQSSYALRDLRCSLLSMPLSFTHAFGLKRLWLERLMIQFVEWTWCFSIWSIHKIQNLKNSINIILYFLNTIIISLKFS